MLFFLYGLEDFLTKRKTKQLKEKFLAKNPAARTDFFDLSQKMDLAELSGMIKGGGGLFSEKKMVIIYGALDQNGDIQEKILAMVKGAAEDKKTTIIFSEGEVKSKKGKLYQFLLKNSKNFESKKLDAKKLTQWLAAEVTERSDGKVAINIGAQNRLAQISRNDLWKVSSEIDKLIAFKLSERNGNKTITLEDINLLCQGEIEAKVFDLVDAVGANDKPRAIELLRNILDQGENEFYIFSMFLYQLRNLAIVAGFRDKFGANTQIISQQSGIHPFVAKKTLDQLRNFSKKHLKGMFDLAAKLDIEVKTGARESMNDALVYFIARS